MGTACRSLAVHPRVKRAKELFEKVSAASRASATERAGEVLETEPEGRTAAAEGACVLERVGVETWLLGRGTVLVIFGPLLLVLEDLERPESQCPEFVESGTVTARRRPPVSPRTLSEHSCLDWCQGGISGQAIGSVSDETNVKNHF